MASALYKAKMVDKLSFHYEESEETLYMKLPSPKGSGKYKIVSLKRKMKCSIVDASGILKHPQTWQQDVRNYIFTYPFYFQTSTKAYSGEVVEIWYIGNGDTANRRQQLRSKFIFMTNVHYKKYQSCIEDYITSRYQDIFNNSLTVKNGCKLPNNEHILLFQREGLE